MYEQKCSWKPEVVLGEGMAHTTNVSDSSRSWSEKKKTKNKKQKQKQALKHQWEQNPEGKWWGQPNPASRENKTKIHIAFGDASLNS